MQSFRSLVHGPYYKIFKKLPRGGCEDRQSDEEEAQPPTPEPPTKKEEVKIQMDEFIANIFGF